MSDLMKNGQAVYRCIHYYAVFEYADDGIKITFPDVSSAITCAMNTAEGIRMAEEALGLALHGTPIEDIPLPSGEEDILLPEGYRAFLITVKMNVREGELVLDGVVDI